MKLYKLTDSKGNTRGDTHWAEGVTHAAFGELDGPLCSSSWIHAYTDPRIAVIINPAHADFQNPLMFEGEGIVGCESGLKVGCRSFTTTKLISLPQVSLNSKIAFGILGALKVYEAKKFGIWAEGWLKGMNRSYTAAHYAADAAAARAAAYAHAYAAAYAYAYAAAYAARAAARAAADADAHTAADAVAFAVDACDQIRQTIDFSLLLDEAMSIT